MTEAQIRRTVTDVVARARVTDIHTHVYSPCFGDLLLWGIDELLTYHYLVAETMRVTDIGYDAFWAMTKAQQADLVWQKLFVERSPVSEACRGILTALSSLGLDVASRDLAEFRRFFAEQRVEDYVDTVFELANLDAVVMTNDPFDASERTLWMADADVDPRFLAALRLDGLLINWQSVGCPRLREWGYDVEVALSERSIAEVRRFLTDWVHRMDALYMAVSLPDSFRMPEDSDRGRLIEECVVPTAKALGIPFAMMIGVRRQVNPRLKLAGDGVGKADLGAVEYLCAKFPDVKFLVTVLARENQHELAVAARKFRNLLVFGCWWFLNNPSIIEDITRMRIELLGLSFVPQHSDARVLDQAVYKWAHSKDVIGRVLADKYVDLAAAGWEATEEEITRDVEGLFGGNFWAFLGRQP